MPALRNILVATDLSAHSDVAIAQAAAIARRDGRSLVLLHVEEAQRHVPQGVVLTERVNDDVGKVIDEIDREARKKLRECADQIRATGVRVDIRVERGYADEEIVAAAEALDADLIVMGTHGHHSLMRVLVGSVTEKVVRTTHTNVLVSRGDPEHVTEPFERILVPTDFSDASAKSLQLAIAMAAPDAKIEVFHTWYYSSAVGAKIESELGILDDFRTRIIEGNTAIADAWIAEHGSGRPIEFSQECGPAAGLIRDRAESEDWDLIAMGTHGRRGFRRFLLGSVAESTIRHARCSVLVAHADRPVTKR